MDKKKINRIIDFVREEMMTTNSTPGKPGFSGKADAEGPTACLLYTSPSPRD